ncbi:hypothetical protein TNCV_2742341 [Trichonephila clavipes]|nr:hypothetical protein TNCV_2742341 [Trichonephila clavipes]
MGSSTLQLHLSFVVSRRDILGNNRRGESEDSLFVFRSREQCSFSFLAARVACFSNRRQIVNCKVKPVSIETVSLKYNDMGLIRGPIVRVHYFVRGGFVGYRSRASSKHLSPHLPVDELDSSGVRKGLRCRCKMHVWVSGPTKDAD